MGKQYLVNGKALNGHDVVEIHLGRAVIGTENLFSVIDGAIYQFSCKNNKNEFDKNPKKYIPKYGGYCSTAISEGALVESNPHSFLVQDGELHLFYKDNEEDTKDEWIENPIEIKKEAELQWLKLTM